MTSGTSSAIRKALELETTAQPASANAGSISFAAVASSAAKTSFGVSFAGAAEFTTSFATVEGIGVGRRQVAASEYFLPADRSEAASHATSNHGCCSSSWINRCPTVPVAPRMPTGILLVMGSSLPILAEQFEAHDSENPERSEGSLYLR